MSAERLSFEGRQAALERRRAELQPALADLSHKAIEAYTLLRPLASHVSEVPREAPLRHQQVQTFSGGRAADYLMVGFGDSHDVILYRNFIVNSDRPYDWRLTRSHLVGDKKKEETKVMLRTETQPPYQHNIKVSTFVYREQVGLNAIHDDFLCTEFDNYNSAETYIAAFEADIERAVREFGG